MKAIVQRRYGSPDVLSLEEVETPRPGPGEVLVKVHAASVSAGDWHLMRGEPWLVRLMMGGLTRPKHATLGSAVAGTVAEVGADVAHRPGAEVFGDLSDCGFGGFAEHVCVPEHALAPKPSGATFEEAAAVPGSGLAALQGLRDKGRIQSGQKVLVNGASGGVGTFAVQIAKALGAEVTGVCSTRNVDLVRSIGADHVIDYTREDYTRGGPRYDLILDAAAYRSISEPLRAVVPGGAYVLVGGAMSRTFQVMVQGPWITRFGKKRAEFFITEANRADLIALKDMVEAGEVRAVVDRAYALAEVPDAIRHVETGHPAGKIVVTM